MSFNLTAWSLFLLFGCFQALILAGVFAFQKYQAKTSGNVMAVLMIVFSIILFDHSLRLSLLYKAIPWGLYISDALWYLIAPLIWLYLKFRMEDGTFRYYDLLHFIPFVLFVIIYRDLPFASNDQKVAILEYYLAAGSTFPLIIKIFILIMMIQMISYLGASMIFLYRTEHRFKVSQSGNEIGEIVLLKRIIVVFSLYFLFEFSFSTFRNFNNIQNSFIENWSLVVWTVFLILFSYVTVRYPGKLFGIIRWSRMKYENIDFEAIKIALVDYMREASPFLNSGLTLSQLAVAININAHQLSYLLNTRMNITFYDYINTARVHHVARQLEQGELEHYSIYGIAQNSGFRSKASFYSFFRKEFKMTPKNYIKSIQDN